MPGYLPDLVAAQPVLVSKRSGVLRSEHRLRRSAEFESTVRRGAHVGRSLVVVHIHTGDEPGDDTPTRVGFIVGKTIGGAVVRNAVRRRLRHVMADRLADLPSGSSVVVRARPEAAHSSSAALARDVDAALRTALNRLGR